MRSPRPRDLPLEVNQKAAAHLLQVSEATLRRWELAGFGPRPLRIGRLVRYRTADLERFSLRGADAQHDRPSLHETEEHRL